MSKIPEPTLPSASSPKNIVIGVIDVGSPKNIGWAVSFDGGRKTGSNLDAFIKTFAERADGVPAALGFEAPLFIPLRDDLSSLTSQRVGEKGRPWSAGAGATVTTIGLAVMSYTLTNLRNRMRGRTAVLDWRKWPQSNAVLMFEAFVSGNNHAGPDEHWKDALHAANAFREAVSNLDSANAVREDSVLSLIGTCLVRTGWCAPSGELLKQPCLVIRPSDNTQ